MDVWGGEVNGEIGDNLPHKFISKQLCEQLE